MIKSYVIEIQTNADGTSGNLVTGFEDDLVAEDAFLQARASANDSDVMIHTILWIDNRGNYKDKPVCYVHPIPQPTNESNDNETSN